MTLVAGDKYLRLFTNLPCTRPLPHIHPGWCAIRTSLCRLVRNCRDDLQQGAFRQLGAVKDHRCEITGVKFWAGLLND